MGVRPCELRSRLFNGISPVRPWGALFMNDASELEALIFINITIFPSLRFRVIQLLVPAVDFAAATVARYRQGADPEQHDDRRLGDHQRMLAGFEADMGPLLIDSEAADGSPGTEEVKRRLLLSPFGK